VETAEGDEALIPGLEVQQGAVHPMGGEEGAAVDHRSQVGELHPLRVGRGEDVDVAGPGETGVGRGRRIGVMVAGGNEDLGFYLFQGVVEKLQGLGTDPLAVEEVPGQEDELGLGLFGGVGQTGQELALLLPPFRCLVRRQGAEGGVQMKVCAMEKGEHRNLLSGAIPPRRSGSR